MVLRLEILYATCVTVRLALTVQGAEQDAEIARCLMWHVAEPLSVQVEVLQAMIRGLERRSAAGQAVRP
jgi:predicted nucleotidyltransferase